MGEYTIDDLVSEADGSSGSSGSGGSGGSGITELIGELDERGVLDRFVGLAEQQMGGGEPAPQQQPEPQQQQPAAPEPADDGGDGSGGIDASDLDADRVATILKQVYDSTGYAPGLSDDPTLTELIKWVESHPRMVDQALKQAL